MNYLVVIPARWASSRFPGKPLADLGGRPVLARVWEKCRQVVDHEQLVIATDDDRVALASKTFGANVVMTTSTCLTGTDRVAQVAEQFDADWYINVQGDEPFVDPLAVSLTLEAATSATETVAAINTMSAIENETEFRSSNVPKVVCDRLGRLLYISRAPIPTDKMLSFRGAHRQIGLYALRKRSLELFSQQITKTPLENIEDIEILRLLELGLHIQMIEVPSGGPAIDTPEDLVRARHLLDEMRGQ